MKSVRWHRVIFKGALVAALVLLGAAPARAEQFVLFQQTFEITKAAVDRSGSHFYVRGPMLTQPPGNNWTGPVDFRNGEVFIQTEVLEKPASGEQNHWSYCYMPNRPIGPGYGCAGSGRYTQTGVYQHSEKMTSWWQNTAISWPQGIKEMHLVIKGIGDSGHLHKRTDVDKLFPTKVRIMMVQVSAGATFDPSKAPGWVASPADGGAPAPADGGVAPDAAGTGGTGGSSTGTGGAGGTGGTGAAGTGGSNSAGAGGSSTGSGGSSSGSGGAGTGTGGSGVTGTGGSGSGTGGSRAGAGGSGDTPRGSGGSGAGPTTQPTVSGGCALGGHGAPASGGAVALLGLAVALSLARFRRHTR